MSLTQRQLVHWPVPQQSVQSFTPLAQLEQLQTHEPQETVFGGHCPLYPSAPQVTLCPHCWQLHARLPEQPALQLGPEQLQVSAKASWEVTTTTVPAVSITIETRPTHPRKERRLTCEATFLDRVAVTLSSWDEAGILYTPFEGSPSSDRARSLAWRGSTSAEAGTGCGWSRISATVSSWGRLFMIPLVTMWLSAPTATA